MDPVGFQSSPRYKLACALFHKNALLDPTQIQSVSTGETSPRLNSSRKSEITYSVVYHRYLLAWTQLLCQAEHTAFHEALALAAQSQKIKNWDYHRRPNDETEGPEYTTQLAHFQAAAARNILTQAGYTQTSAEDEVLFLRLTDLILGRHVGDQEAEIALFQDAQALANLQVSVEYDRPLLSPSYCQKIIESLHPAGLNLLQNGDFAAKLSDHGSLRFEAARQHQ